MTRILTRNGDDALEDWQMVPVSATFVDSLGERIEFGPWSLTEDEARCLAVSLVQLADVLADLRASSVPVTRTEKGTAHS
jgi:hypothetical protein